MFINHSVVELSFIFRKTSYHRRSVFGSSVGRERTGGKALDFYQEGEKVIEHGPNPYLALYYVKTENRKEMDLLTEEFYEKMHILDPNGQEVAYHNQIPDYAPAEK